MPKARPQTQNDPAIIDPKVPYHVRLFINGRQCGNNQTFIDWYADGDAAIADARSYFTGEGYRVDDRRIILSLGSGFGHDGNGFEFGYLD